MCKEFTSIPGSLNINKVLSVLSAIRLPIFRTQMYSNSHTHTHTVVAIHLWSMCSISRVNTK